MEIVVLYCGRSLAPDSFIPEGWREGAGYKARFIQVPCSSKVEPNYLVKLFEHGADGVLLSACPRRECQCLFGDSCAEQRVGYVQKLLDEVGLGGTRLRLVSKTGITQADLSTLAGELAASLCELGPSPVKMAEASK